MIPSPWVAAVLTFATFRLIRLASYDSFPPVARLRGWLIGEHETTSGSQNQRMGLTSDPVQVTTSYRRPVLAGCSTASTASARGCRSLCMVSGYGSRPRPCTSQQYSR